MIINWKKVSSMFTPAILIIAGFFLFACSQNTDSNSFMSVLDRADTYIRTSQPEEAVKQLKKASRLAYSAYSRIGIYRRFMALGEKDLAEKILASGIKKIPENLELRAVYAQHLLRDNRVEEAVKIAEKLKGTRYASIYSESVLKTADKTSYISPSLCSVYKDCYEATGNEKWLVNAVLPLVKNGDYSGAASMQDKIESSEAVFWAIVQYDAGNFDLCIENLDYAQKNGITERNVPLASDAYVMLGDYDSAEKERDKLIALAHLEYDVKVPEITMVNSAIWAYNAKQYSRAYDLLTQVVFKNPMNIPGLLTYGKFAWADSEVEEEDMLEQALRKTELRSWQMMQKDDRPRFLMEDVYQKVENALETQKRNNNVSDELIVEKLDLYLKKNSDLPSNKLVSEIWKTLELNESELNQYPPLLVDYVVCKLLNCGLNEDARNLFERYLDSRYLLRRDEINNEVVQYDVFGGVKKYAAPPVPDFILKAAFGDRAANYAATMELWEIEMAAYFTLQDGNIEAARKLYEYALFETGGVKTLLKGNNVVAFSTLAKISSAVNLASIYSSTGELEKSMSLYGLASGRTRNKQLKSLILYRTALVQKDMENINGAVLSLDYAISLDPLNADARLLRKKLK